MASDIWRDLQHAAEPAWGSPGHFHFCRRPCALFRGNGPPASMQSWPIGAEADRLCGADRYERSEGRKDRCAGSYQRSLDTRAGKISLKVPKRWRQTFETAIIERYRRRESSVEEALVEMYPAGVSVRRVEDITEALWGTRVSPGTVSNLNKSVGRRKRWRKRTRANEVRQSLAERGFEPVRPQSCRAVVTRPRKRPCDGDLRNPALAGRKWP